MRKPRETVYSFDPSLGSMDEIQVNLELGRARDERMMTETQSRPLTPSMSSTSLSGVGNMSACVTL